MKDAAHFGLARKYRPQQFKDVVGQDAVAVTLSNAVASEKPAQAYLFYGPKGVGKTTSARILAKALNCKKGPTPTPCGKCASCVEIALGSSIDVLELDAASHTQVEKIREMIIETVALAPSRDKKKIFIIDEVHMLSNSSFNALLKTLEEPPAHVVFILATTELAKIPATIVSRCQRFRFRPITETVIVPYLGRLAKSEKIKADKAALELIARAASGAMRDAVSLLEQVAAFSDGAVTKDKVGELMGMLPDEFQAGLARAILAKDAAALNRWLERATSEGFDTTQLLKDLRERFQEMYLHRLGAESPVEEEWSEIAGETPPEVFSFILQRINRTLEEMRGADSPQLAFELGLYGMLESSYDLRDWIRRLEALEKRLVEGSPAASPAKTPAPVGNVWPAVLNTLDKTQPALAGSLVSSRLLQNDGRKWRLVLSNGFNRDRAASSQATIEEALSSAAGKNITLTLEVEAGVKSPSAPAKPRKAGRPSTESGGGTSSHKGSVAVPDEETESDPVLRKVLGAFSGAKIRREKKKSE